MTYVRRRSYRHLLAGMAWGSLVAGMLPSGVHAQPADFYRDKQLAMVIGYTPGGSYDNYARVVAQYLPRFLNDRDGIVVRNMPGAASFTAANFLYNQAPRDGTTVGVIGQALVLGQLFQQPGISFDMGRFNWIGRINSAVEMTLSTRTDRVATIADAQKNELTIGATTAQSTTSTLPTVMNRVLGTKFKIVLGYGGFSNLFLAMERGEVDGGHTDVTNLATMRPGWLAAHKAAVLVQYARQRHPAFPDVPAMPEFGRTPDEKDLLGLYGSMTEVGYSIVAPPDLPLERVAALRAAFTAMCADKAFRGDMESRHIDIDCLPGERLQQQVRETLGVRPEIAARGAREWKP